MREILKKSNEPFESVFNDLKLFEQTQYCYDYLKNKFLSESDDLLKEHAEIASACFRQAKEYYSAASQTNLNANPLLYAYSLNNLLKGTCFLISCDDDILKGFKAHGFKVNESNLYDNLLNSKITFMTQKGAVHSLLKLFDNFLDSPQDITFNQLLRHIPDLEDVYFKSSGSVSFLAKENINDHSEYVLVGSNLNEDVRNIFKKFGFICSIIPRDNVCIGYTNMKNKQAITNGIYSKNNVYYREYLNIPEKFNEGLKDVNVSFYCYLLIMSYGMLVRYNAHKWEKYIDKKDSKEAILIELSIKNSVEHFFYQMHNLLFGYSYNNKPYNDYDVKRVINDSTTTIMNNITKEIEHQNIVYNSHERLPWHKNYR